VVLGPMALLARKAKAEGKGDGVLGVGEEAFAVGPRVNPQPVGSASGGADLDPNADKRVDGVVLSDGGDGRVNKRPRECALRLFRGMGELAESGQGTAVALERLDPFDGWEGGEGRPNDAVVPRPVAIL